MGRGTRFLAPSPGESPGSAVLRPGRSSGCWGSTVGGKLDRTALPRACWGHPAEGSSTPPKGGTGREACGGGAEGSWAQGRVRDHPAQTPEGADSRGCRLLPLTSGCPLGSCPGHLHWGEAEGGPGGVDHCSERSCRSLRGRGQGVLLGNLAEPPPLSLSCPVGHPMAQQGGRAGRPGPGLRSSPVGCWRPSRACSEPLPQPGDPTRCLLLPRALASHLLPVPWGSLRQGLALGCSDRLCPWAEEISSRPSPDVQGALGTGGASAGQGAAPLRPCLGSQMGGLSEAPDGGLSLGAGRLPLQGVGAFTAPESQPTRLHPHWTPGSPQRATSRCGGSELGAWHPAALTAAQAGLSQDHSPSQLSLPSADLAMCGRCPLQGQQAISASPSALHTEPGPAAGLGGWLCQPEGGGVSWPLPASVGGGSGEAVCTLWIL